MPGVGGGEGGDSAREGQGWAAEGGEEGALGNRWLAQPLQEGPPPILGPPCPPPPPFSLSLASHLGRQNPLHPSMLWVSHVFLGRGSTHGGAWELKSLQGSLGGPLGHKRGRPTGCIGGTLLLPEGGRGDWDLPLES